MNCGRTFYGVADQFVDRGDDPLGIELPIDKEAICRKAAMQRARSNTVKIRDEFAANGAEAIEVEMSVPRFQGIKSPLNVRNSTVKCFVALKEFQQATNAAIAMRSQDASHV